MTSNVLESIGKGVKRYFEGKIPKISIYQKDGFVSFGFYVDEAVDHVGISLYESQNSFHGNLTNGGYFTGSYNQKFISIYSSDSGESATVYF